MSTHTYDDDTAGLFDGEPGLGQEPPNDLAAEMSVLGGLLISADYRGDVVEALGGYQGAAFYQAKHETIYNAIADMHARDVEITPITVGHELTKRGELGKVGGAGYLHELVMQNTSPAMAEAEAEIVVDRAKLRRASEAIVRARQRVMRGEGAVEDVVEAVVTDLSSVIETDQADDTETDTAGLALMACDEAERAKREGAISGIPTGFADLDSLTGGLQGGQMVVIAARPAMGKSTLALDIARSASIANEFRSAVFSLEMGRLEISQRVMSAEAVVPLHHIRKGTLADTDWSKMAAATARMGHDRLKVYDAPTVTMTQIRARCRRLAQTAGLDLVVIDYLQLMQGAGRRAENRQVEVSQMSRDCKTLAKELGVPVVVLSQLNRGPEQRESKRPMVSDLRESGAIEQDADVVILLHREDAYEKESPRAGEADLIVAKHRNGPTSTITVAFQGHYSRFVDMAQT